MYSIQGTQVLPSLFNDDPRMTCFFTGRSYLRPHTFVLGKMLENHFLKMC